MDGRIISTTASFYQAIRDRRQGLGLSHLEVDDLAGLAEGHTSKIEAFGRHYNKRVLSITDTLAPLLDALGLALVVMPASDAHALYGNVTRAPLKRKPGTKRKDRKAQVLSLSVRYES